ncbi:hypothetical protein C7459_104237 [Tumebacillus permanentifrigoris]|uniref:Uncharacterized protein n=1 Tax=Tumebacillus permanentifrigoris TaxID=378543 RepID=A0A316DY35_9BACL|nr:hypothetical protein C7459_104237 [Tumebacillus permanentifrigoris]
MFRYDLVFVVDLNPAATVILHMDEVTYEPNRYVSG